MIRQSVFSQSRGGYSLIELIVSLGAGSMLLVGMASAIGIAGKSIRPPLESSVVLKGAELSHVVADELQSAVHIRDYSSTMLDVVVPDRNSDGNEDSLGYSWNDSAGEFRREFNGSPATIGPELSLVEFSPHFRSVDEVLGGLSTQTSAGSLSQLTSSPTLNSWTLTTTASAGHVFEISHPPGTTAYAITSIELSLARAATVLPGEVLTVQLREATGDGLPTSHVFESQTIDISTLSTTFNWVPVNFTERRFAPATRLCVVVLADNSLSGSAGRVAYSSTPQAGIGSMVSTEFYDHTWKEEIDSYLYFQSVGYQVVLDGSSHTVQRNYLTGLTAQYEFPDVAQSLRRTARFLNTPEDLNEFWKLDFDVRPTWVDANFDSTVDWTTAGLSNWPSQSVQLVAAGEEVESSATDPFNGLITIDVRMQATDAGAEAFVEVPFGADDSMKGVATLKTIRSANGTSSAVVELAGTSAPLIAASDNSVGDAMTEFRVVIDPTNNNVATWINDMFRGRVIAEQPLGSGNARIRFGAIGGNTLFDFLSVRVGR